MGRRGGAWAAEGGLCLGTGARLSQGLRSLPVGFGVTQEMECLGGWGSLMAPHGSLLLCRRRPSCCRQNAGLCVPAGPLGAENPQPTLSHQ